MSPLSLAKIPNTTTTSNHKSVPAFTSHGHTYHTMASVSARVAFLAVMNHNYGPSDGRLTEQGALIEDLQSYAVQHLSASEYEARITVYNTFNIMTYVTSEVCAPALSVFEELSIQLSKVNDVTPTH